MGRKMGEEQQQWEFWGCGGSEVTWDMLEDGKASFEHREGEELRG